MSDLLSSAVIHPFLINLIPSGILPIAIKLSPKINLPKPLKGSFPSNHFIIFSGEIFVVPKDYNPKFLGDDFAFCVQPSACSVDIDDSNDLEILDIRISLKKSAYEQFLHND